MTGRHDRWGYIGSGEIAGERLGNVHALKLGASGRFCFLAGKDSRTQARERKSNIKSKSENG